MPLAAQRKSNTARPMAGLRLFLKFEAAAAKKAAKEQAAAEKVACAAAKREATKNVLSGFSPEMWGMVIDRLLDACVLTGAKQLIKQPITLCEITKVTQDFHALVWLSFTNKIFADCIWDKIRTERVRKQLDGFLMVGMCNVNVRSIVFFGKNDYQSHLVYQKFERLASFSLLKTENPAREKGDIIWPRPIDSTGTTRTSRETVTVDPFMFVQESRNNCCNTCNQYTPKLVLGGTCWGKLCSECERGNLWTDKTVENK